MKKIIFKILMGALLIAIVVLIGGRQYLSMKKKEYRQQLENTINNIYLEGKDVIGAYYYHQNDKDSTTVSKVSLILHDGFSRLLWDYPGISTVNIWGGQNIDNTSTIRDVLKSGDYKWYDFRTCATTFRPFMIIVKKTNRGYDVIGEFILGIALTYSYPDYLIRETSSTFNWGKFGNYDIGEQTSYSYHIKTDMIDSYIKNLFENKYNGITIRNEVTNDGTERNVKFNMLDGLVMKGACPADSSLYFRVNKYFELKFDDYFTEIGSSPLVWQTGSYGNYAQRVFTNTVTMHYSIRENEGVLEEELKKKAIIYSFLLEFLYLLLTITIVRRKRKHNSSIL